MKKMYLLLLFLFITSTVYSQFMQAGISNRLYTRLQNSTSNDQIKILVLLKDRVDIEALDMQLYQMNASAEFRAKTVITALMDKAAMTQPALISYLEEQRLSGKVNGYRPFWITNFISVEARPEVILQLAGKMEVDVLDIDAELDYDKPVAIEPAAGERVASSEVGLKVINAHKMWEIGITGTGRVVMNDDTGVDGNHPALNYKWRGNTSSPWYHAWLDPAGGTNFPSDCDNHGTHTMGIMTGRAGTDTIGVAPGAEWIAAKTICSGNGTSNHMASWQWALNPDSNVNTITDMPDGIGNSWHDPTGVPSQGDCASTIYLNALASMEAGGVAIVFSCGNSGPGASTITRPKNINVSLVNSFSVGNINGNTSYPYAINSSSSRGPGYCGNTGKFRFKPEVSAPGTSVRSSIRNGAYSSLTGTSMACPHVVGSVTLLRQAFPNATGKQCLEALYWTARDLGTPGEDNSFGMGFIDVWAAYQYLGKNICRQQNVIILDNSTNYDTLNFSTGGTITDVNFTMGALTHSKTGDVEFSIKSPAGTEVILASRRGGTGDNFINTVFNDSAANPISSGTPPFAGSFRPESPLSVFNGQSQMGDWIFRVNDNAASDTGRVMNYCLTIRSNAPTGIGNNNSPVSYALEQNYPNPFNPNTSIRYSIPKQSFVRLVIYDISGKEVAVLSNDVKQAGSYEAIFNASGFASGVYFYSIEADGFKETKKMVLIK
ncbi:MAG: S8 family serine peptidase [Ignavibacteria bacterium]|nr:S8 family serine peptidase [Ignavibacteria bacterium]MCC7158344.1 S8 family serine peptidase [Ignavibacteria bacterium]